MRKLALLAAGTLLAGFLSLPVSAADLDIARYQGKVVYLDFWASWCAPCRRSFPWMNRMQQKYGEAGLVVIGVNVDSDPAAAREFLQEIPADFRIVYDPEGELAERYQLMGMPTSFVIDRDGKIHGSHIGFRESSPENYEREIRALLEIPADRGGEK